VTGADPLPDDIEMLKAMLLAERGARLAAEAEAHARAVLIEQLEFTIAKLRRERYGASSERSDRLIAQLELQLVELEETASAAETAVEIAQAQAGVDEARTVPRRKPARRPLPEHLPRERIVYPAPTACPCCGTRR